MLAKAGPAGARAGAPLTGLSSSAPKSATISAHQAEEAKRCAAEGVRQVQQRQFAQGIALLNRAIELRPSMASLRHDLGVALMAAGQLKEAAAAFNAALGLDPRLPSAHFHIGQILENLGQLDKAIPAFEAAVALAPDVVAAQMRLGSFYLDRRMYAKSEAAFRAAAAAGKGTVTAAIAEAGALEASGAIDNAVAAIRALVDSYPENAVCHSLLAMHAAKSGNSAEFRPALRARRRAFTRYGRCVVRPRGQQEVHRWRRPVDHANERCPDAGEFAASRPKIAPPRAGQGA